VALTGTLRKVMLPAFAASMAHREHMSPATPFDDRVVVSIAKRRRFNPRALSALLKARELLALSLGLLLAKVRETADPVQGLMARVKELEVLLAQAREEADILRARLERLEPRRRPRYSPRQRFRILLFMKTYVMSVAETARRFLVSTQTLARWMKEASLRPDRDTVGSLIEPVPPVRRYDDVTRHLIQHMDEMGFGGNDTIAHALARAGWRVSPRTVGRVRKEKRIPEPGPLLPPRALEARRPNHVWMMDLTEIPSLFRIFSFKLGVVIDVFSRMPLARRVFLAEPRAKEVAGLLEQAASSHGAPRHFVSDRGAQFTAETFQAGLKALGIRQRFGAIGKTGSIAIVERLWRTLKEALGLAFLKPLTREELERRLKIGLLHYAYLRPHQALQGATPAEVYFGIRPAHLSAVSPPRGRPGQRSTGLGLVAVHVDPERRLPILLPKAA
jgi:transposase InsO family protein